jgi:hypothetical protein
MFIVNTPPGLGGFNNRLFIFVKELGIYSIDATAPSLTRK